MSDLARLRIVRTVHTAIYLVMVAATFTLLYAAISGATGAWLWIALGLLGIESAVFPATASNAR